MTRYYRGTLTCAAATLALAGLTAMAPAALAQPVPQTSLDTPDAAVQAYWTPERMRSAKVIDLRPVSVPNARRDAPKLDGTPLFHPGAAPTVKIDTGSVRAPNLPAQAGGPSPGMSTENVGNGGAYFTTTRVFPTDAPKTYPNSAAGILYFTDPNTGGNFICSASAIGHRIILTAGHCTAHASTTAPYFYTNWLFLPAYSNGSEPYKSWTVNFATTTSNWYYSDGSVPNVQDVGMLVANDQKIKKSTESLGNVTGWLGWWTLWGQGYPNNIQQLGYPCNLDSCTLMEGNNAQGFAVTDNTVEIGSSMQGGSSGGPWIQDYGVAPAGAPAYTAGNWVIAVTSYEFTDLTQQIEGASIFENAGYSGNGFGDLWNTVCAEASGNC
jgi:V8-like Glu-specific endopeptidase